MSYGLLSHLEYLAFAYRIAENLQGDMAVKCTCPSVDSVSIAVVACRIGGGLSELFCAVLYTDLN